MRRLVLALTVLAAAGWGAYALLSTPRPDDVPTPPADPVADAGEADGAPASLRGDSRAAARSHRGARTVRGTVIDLEGDPVADVPVAVDRIQPRRLPGLGDEIEDSSRPAPERLAAVRSDPAGRFAVGNLPRGPDVTLRVQAQPTAPLLGSQAVVREHDGSDVEVTLQVKEGVPLALRVVRFDGAGVAARIDLHLLRVRTTIGRLPMSWQLDPAWTGSDGRLVLPCVPAGLYFVNVLVPDAIELRGLRVPAPAQGEHVIRLPGGGSCGLAGVVKDSSGAGVYEARLVATVVLPPGSDAYELRRAVTTAADGRYALDALVAGTLTDLRVTAAGLLPRTFENLGWTLEAGPVLPFDVTLAAGGAVTGRVLDPEGKGIPGAVVEVHARGRTGPSCACGADGSYRLEGVAPGEHVLQASKDGYYVPAKVRPFGDSRRERALWSTPGAVLVTVPEDGGTARRDFTLHPGVRVSGVVLDASGEPTAGARVAVGTYIETSDLPPMGSSTMHGVASGTTTSDGQGRFVFAGLQPSARKVFMAARSEGMVSGAVEIVVAEGAGSLQGIELRLLPAATLAGRVVDADGKPKTAALVWLPPSTNARADVAGRFRITGLRAGTYTLQVNGPIRGPSVTRSVAAGEVVEDLVLVAPALLRVQGFLVDEAGDPRPLVRIRFECDEPGHTYQGYAYADADGAFVVEDLPPGTYRVRTEDGLEAGTVEAGAAGVRLVGRPSAAPPVHLVHGEVRDPDGNPLASGRVSISFAADPPSRGTTSRSAGIVRGRFRREIRTSAITIGLSVHDAKDALGLPVIHEPVRMRDLPIEDSPFRIELTAPGAVAGRVVDDAGAGVEGIPVTAHHGPRRGRTDRSRRRTTCVTIADGSFRLEELCRGEVTLSIAAPQVFHRVADRSVQTGDENVVIRLVRGAVISGRVVGEDGEPLANVPIQAQPSKHMRGGLWGHARSGADGSFVLVGLDPHDTYEVRTDYDERGDYPTLMRCFVPDVRPGATDVLVVARLGVFVEGVVVLPDGSPAAGVSVHAQPVDGDPNVQGNTWYPSTEPNGSFRIGPMPRGRHRLHASPRSPAFRASDPVEVDVPGESVRLVLRSQPTRPGRVLGEDLDGFQVAAIVSGANVDPCIRWRDRLNADGSFAIPFAHGETFTVIVYGPNDDRYGIVPDVKLEEEPLQIELVTGLSIEGRVEPFETGRRRAGMVYAESLEYGYRTMGMIDEEGKFRIRGLPPGEYDLTVFPFPRGDEPSATTVAAGATGIVLEAPAAPR